MAEDRAHDYRDGKLIDSAASKPLQVGADDRHSRPLPRIHTGLEDDTRAHPVMSSLG